MGRDRVTIFAIGVTIIALTAATIPVRNSVRQFRDAHRVRTAREAAHAESSTNPLSIFSPDDIAALAQSVSESHVFGTRLIRAKTPDPWAAGLRMAPHLLPVHANRLRDFARVGSLTSDLVVVLAGALLGASVSNIVSDISSGREIGTGNLYLTLFATFATLIAGQIRMVVVSGWKQAARRYRLLHLEARQGRLDADADGNVLLSLPDTAPTSLEA